MNKVKKEILAIIPARGGSKGVPKKNIKELCNKPLIGYTIEAARKSAFITRVVVSTDDIEIATISKKFQAEIPCMRPSELASDESPTIDAIIQMIDYLKLTEGYEADYIVLLQPTSPFRTNHHIDEALIKLFNSKMDAIVSICEAEVNPYWSNILEGEKLKYFIEEGKHITRRQELPDIYRLNGAIYAVKKDILLANKTFEPENLTGYIMSNFESIDIDSKLDFKMAELIMEDLNN